MQPKVTYGDQLVLSTRVLLETAMPPVFGKESVVRGLLHGITDRGAFCITLLQSLVVMRGKRDCRGTTDIVGNAKGKMKARE